MSWDDEDRAAVIAFALEKALVCQSCGTAPWEWDIKQGGDPVAYEPLAIRCEGCAAKDVARETVVTDKQPGTTLALIPRAVADRMTQTRSRRPPSRRERARGNQ